MSSHLSAVSQKSRTPCVQGTLSTCVCPLQTSKQEASSTCASTPAVQEVSVREVRAAGSQGACGSGPSYASAKCSGPARPGLQGALWEVASYVPHARVHAHNRSKGHLQLAGAAACKSLYKKQCASSYGGSVQAAAAHSNPADSIANGEHRCRAGWDCCYSERGCSAKEETAICKKGAPGFGNSSCCSCNSKTVLPKPTQHLPNLSVPCMANTVKQRLGCG